MKVYFILFFSLLSLLTESAFGQSLGTQYYDNSSRQYVAPPIDSRIEAMRITEKRYYEDQERLSSSQEVNCDDLIDYVKTKGYRKGTVSSISLINSDWLKEVEAYTIDNLIVVIAEIKKDEWGINTKKYIFCGIPDSNWSDFYYGMNDVGKTYGERFHKYIIDYQCKCN
jgi:hypothetical protein